MFLKTILLLLTTAVIGWWLNGHTEDWSGLGLIVSLASAFFLLVTLLVAIIGATAGIEVEAPKVCEAKTYSNNQYVDGAGWFHARSRTFQPHVFNHHDARRGYFHDGVWSATPAEPVAEAKPEESAADAANAAILTYARRGGFGTSGIRHGGGC